MKIRLSNEKNISINKNMMGLFFEDINYAADGGLYAELIENRSFSFVKAEGDFADYYITPAGDYAWSTNNKKGECRIVSGSSLSESNPNYMRINICEPGFGIVNKAYEGIYLKKDEKLNVLLWIRNVKFDGSFCVEIKKADKSVAKASVSYDDYIDSKYNFWKLYSLQLTANDCVEAADFVLSFDKEGVVEVNYVSAIPDSAVAGIFRKDLFELLRDIHPGFVRFPGGCIVEGNTLQNRYNYKNTLKPTWDRKSNWNRWAVHGNNKDNNYSGKYAWYNQTLGMGFYEYFLLCEMIGAKALPVLNVGLACQYQSKELVEIESDEFKEFIKDALDLIEFANGSTDTKWGLVRKEMGHEAPFNLEMLGIGNEQWETKETKFFDRYVQFEKAIHEKHPEIKLIGSAGPDITSERYTMAWDFYRKNKDIKNFAYALDEHYYVKPEYLFEHNDFYDNYDREIKVFSGEYAAHPICDFNRYDANTLYGALSEAAFLTGVERNGDVVVLASYAPLFARVNYAQWAPDMIWFDSKVAYGTPSYHVQKMYANNMGDYTLKVYDLEQAIKEGIYYNLSFDSNSGDRILKIVNSNDCEKKIEFIPDVEPEKTIKAITLTGPMKDAYNYVDACNRVSAKEYEIDNLSNVSLPAYSFSVIRF